MSEMDIRLIRCFSSVFPGLTPDEIRATNAESVGVWDSLSGVTLTAVIEEEFGVEFDPEVLPQLDSFEAFRTFFESSNPTKE